MKKKKLKKLLKKVTNERNDALARYTELRLKYRVEAMGQRPVEALLCMMRGEPEDA